MAKSAENKLKKLLKTIKEEDLCVEYQFNETEPPVEFHIRRNVSWSEKFAMTENIVADLFAGGKYYPCAFRPVVWFWVLSIYTDLPMGGFVDKNGGVMDAVMDFVNGTDIQAQFRKALGDELDYTMKEISAAVQQELSDRDPVKVLLRGLIGEGTSEAPKVTEEDLQKMKTMIDKIAGLNNADFINAVKEQENKTNG